MERKERRTHLDTRRPELLAHLHSLLEKTVSETHNVYLRRLRPPNRVPLLLRLLEQQGEETLDTERDTDARNATGGTALSRKHADELVVTTSSGDRSDTDRRLVDLGFLVVVECRLLALEVDFLLGGGRDGFGGGSDGDGGSGALYDGLVDDTGVVVETASEREVEGHLKGKQGEKRLFAAEKERRTLAVTP